MATKGNGLAAPHDQPAETQTKDKRKFTARQARVLNALLPGNWITRESIDRIAGASNGPQVIAEIRRKVAGFDGLEMMRVEGIDRDGQRPSAATGDEAGAWVQLDAEPARCCRTPRQSTAATIRACRRRQSCRAGTKRHGTMPGACSGHRAETGRLDWR